jgi:hypothetical protein
MMSLVSAERDAETRTATGSWHVIRFDSASSEAMLRYTYYSLSELDYFVFSFPFVSPAIQATWGPA